MKRLDELMADKAIKFTGSLNLERFYSTLVKILEEKYNVKIKYTIKEKTPEELAEDAQKSVPFDTCVEEALMPLTDQELRVLGLKFGYNNCPQSRKYIGLDLGISGDEVTKIEKSAFAKLRIPEQLKKLHPFLYQALEHSGFYSRLFAAIFKLKEENVDNLLKAGPSSFGEDQILREPIRWAEIIPDTQGKRKRGSKE